VPDHLARMETRIGLGGAEAASGAVAVSRDPRSSRQWKSRPSFRLPVRLRRRKPSRECDRAMASAPAMVPGSPTGLCLCLFWPTPVRTEHECSL